MNYTLHQLRVFLKIADNQSITRAAEELHLTQPAVSIQLKNFQDQFAIPLTEVVGRQLYVTQFGLEIAEAAKNILNETDAINYKSLSDGGLLAGRLNFSVVSTGKYVIPYFLSDFINRHPGIDLVMNVTNKTIVVDSLAKNDPDFALVSVLPERMELEVVPLMMNKLFYVGSSKLKLGAKPSRKTLLKDMPLIFRENGSATRNAMEEFIEKNKFAVAKRIELTSNEAVKQAVLAGLGCSIMPLIGIKNELLNGDLQILPVKGLPINTQWNLIWLKSKNLSPSAKAFVSYIREEKERIIRENFKWIDDY